MVHLRVASPNSGRGGCAAFSDKDSGIVNDANDYAVETMSNPRYPLELFQRVVTVSLETMKIVKSLPRLEVQQPGQTANQLTEAKDAPDALTA